MDSALGIFFARHSPLLSLCSCLRHDRSRNANPKSRYPASLAKSGAPLPETYLDPDHSESEHRFINGGNVEPDGYLSKKRIEKRGRSDELRREYDWGDQRRKMMYKGKRTETGFPPDMGTVVLQCSEESLALLKNASSTFPSLSIFTLPLWSAVTHNLSV